MLILARHLSFKLFFEAESFARCSQSRLSAVFCAYLEVVKMLLARFWLQTTYFHLPLTFAVRFSSLPLTSLFLHLYSVEKHLLMDFWLAVLVKASRFCIAVLHLIRIPLFLVFSRSSRAGPSNRYNFTFKLNLLFE